MMTDTEVFISSLDSLVKDTESKLLLFSKEGGSSSIRREVDRGEDILNAMGAGSNHEAAQPGMPMALFLEVGVVGGTTFCAFAKLRSSIHNVGCGNCGGRSKRWNNRDIGDRCTVP